MGKIVSDAEYDRLLARQGGVCALCGKAPNPKRRLDADHDHQTGRVRGLLHNRCNRALAPFEWDSNVMRRVVIYLERIIEDRFYFTLNITPADDEEKS